MLNFYQKVANKPVFGCTTSSFLAHPHSKIMLLTTCRLANKLAEHKYCSYNCIDIWKWYSYGLNREYGGIPAKKKGEHLVSAICTMLYCSECLYHSVWAKKFSTVILWMKQVLMVVFLLFFFFSAFFHSNWVAKGVWVGTEGRRGFIFGWGSGCSKDKREKYSELVTR